MTSRYRLPNGLTVVASPQRQAPVVAFQVWVKVGSADEAPDEVGLAHLHEHMLFKGTGRRGIGEIARSIEAHGGEINAWTSFDQTVYHVVMASRHAWQGLDVLADAVRNSSFDPQELQREIEVVCEEIKRSTDMPARRASRSFFSECYRVHPYGRPVIGFESNVRAHTRDHVLGFYGKHYRPGNIVLSAVGDFDQADLRQQVEKHFGGEWGRSQGVVVERPREPDWKDLRVALTNDDSKDAHVHLGFQIEGVEHPDTAALDVLAMVLGQGDSSRLSLEVRRKRSLARDVTAWAWTPRQRGLFASSIVATPQSVAEAFREVTRVMAALTRESVEESEVETVKSLLEAEAIYQRETVQGLARKLGYYESMAGGLEREARYYEAVSQVTAASIREVAARTFTFDRAVVTGMLPPGTAFTEDDVRTQLAHVAKEKPPALPPRAVEAARPLRLAPSHRAARSTLVSERLPNGAKLLIREERSAPLFALRASFLGGLRYETPANNGINALLSRTITRGTETLGPEQLSHVVDSLAGSLSAIAGRNSLSMRGEFLSKHFDRALELFAEVMQRPAFPEAELERERALQLQDISSRDDRAPAVAMELFAKTLWSTHPYRMPSSGERSTVEGLNVAAIRAYHDAYVDPSQLTLAVVGDVDADLVGTRVRELFGRSRGRALPPPSVPSEPPRTGPQVVRKALQKAQSHLVFGFPGLTLRDPRRRALEVLQTMLSGQSGRLFLELREKRSMAYSVSASSVEGLDGGAFSVYMGTSPEKVDAAVAEIRNQLSRLRDDRATEHELSRAREHIIGTQSIGLQRNGARAGVIALDACYDLPPEGYLTYPEEIAAVTADDVRAVAASVFDFERSVLVIVGPET